MKKYSGPRIREMRLKLRWSQQILARAAGCSRNSVALVEKGLEAPVKQKIVEALVVGKTEP